MILVVGDVMTDVIVRPSGPLARGTDCAARIDARPGGSGANVACWVGALGGAAAFAGRVGREDASAQEAALRAQGVTPHLALDDTAPTGRIVAIIEADGERSFYTDRGANLNLCDADLPGSLLDPATWLHVSGHALFAARPRAAALALMRHAYGRGIPVSVDAGSLAFLMQTGRDAFLAWTSGATVCFANTPEAAALAAGPEDFPCRVVTRGAEGAEAWHRAGHATAPALAADLPETTGGGDAAVAGFLLAFTAGEPLPDCLAAAMTAGRRAVCGLGARPSIG